MGSRMRRAAMVLCVALVIAGCGGGGDGDDAPARPVLPTLVQDPLPPSNPVDVRPLEFYPAHAGDRWLLRDASNAGATLLRRVVALAGAELTLQDQDGAAVLERRYRRTAAGLVRVQPLAAELPAALRQSLPEWLELPEQIGEAGQVRELLRQGTLDSDIDGDGHADSFRVQIRQTVVGREDPGLPAFAGAEALHLSTAIRTELHPSSPRSALVAVVVTEDSWWLPGIGLARWRSAATDGQGVVIVPPREYGLEQAWIDGQSRPAAR